MKAGPNLSREALYNAFNGGFSYGYGAAVGPISYPRDHHGTDVELDFVQDEGKSGGYVERIPLTKLTQIPNPAYKP